MSTGAGEAVVISDLPAPIMGLTHSLSGPVVPPAHIIYFYSPDSWEEFIKEWALGLGEKYVQIKRLGGPGDEGIDVAAFKSDQGLEGPWDCFQGKHYAGPLEPADAWKEMLKVFSHAVAGDYVLPDTYQFLAPRGCGGTLNRLLSKPTKLRKKFLDALDAGGALVKNISAEALVRIRELAEATDFSMFKSVELHDALDTHSKTKYHVARFGGSLPGRSEVGEPPEDLGEHEATYVAELRKVYSESCDDDLKDAGRMTSHAKFGSHFKRQRFSFYAAESLRMDVRDAVPDGTFERLQDDVHSGVIEVAEADHHSGMDRLSAVLSQSVVLDLSAHPLVSLTRPEDRKGICHQLANDSRLTWTPGDES